MKTYKDSLLHTTLSVIPTEFKKSKYFFVLKSPALLIMMVIGIPLSLVIDFFVAVGDCEKSY